MKKLWVLGLGMIAVAGSAGAQNLLTNGGFETGDLTGWTQGAGDCLSDNTISVSNSINGGVAVEGSYFAYFNFVGCHATLSQGFTPVIGDSYIFSAFISPSNGGALGGTASVTTSGEPAFLAEGSVPASGTNADGGQEITGTFTATSTTDLLQISANNMFLDRVSIVDASTVPEPGPLALLATGLLGIVPFARRKRMKVTSL